MRSTLKIVSLATIALMSGLVAASATMYPAETKNLRPDSARSLCLDLSGDAKLANCNGSNAQKISLERRENGIRIMRVGSQCVEANREGEPLFLAPCRNVTTQTWSYSSAGQVKNGNGLCVDVFRNQKTAGTPVIAYRCNGTVNQRWARYDLPKPETPANSASSVTLHPGHARNKCLDATDRGRLVLWTCHGGRNQKFTFNYGKKTIIRAEGGCLTAIAPNEPVAIRNCMGGARQMWTVEQNGRITNENGGCLDVKMAAQQDGTQILSFRCNGQPNQRFTAAR